MARPQKAQPVAESLDGFQSITDDQGISLDELSGSLANLLGHGADPYTEQEVPDDECSPPVTGPDRDDAASDAHCPVSPRSILEAIFFVGHPSNEPLTAPHLASLMRGVRPSEIDELIEELNAVYAEEGCPYAIRPAGIGYRMELVREYEPIREKFYGKVREARLSQAAIDVLAIVAYNQPVDRNGVDHIRREESGRILSQLVRRELICITRTAEKPRRTLYSTTPRFLTFFGLASLDELPQSHDFDRN